MKTLRILALLALTSCAATGELPRLVRPPDLDSLERVARLPPYLVPPPARASAQQTAKWVEAQTTMLSHVGAPAGKVKLKNVGNADSHAQTSVQEGITGRQLATVAGLLLGLLLLLKLGPPIVKSFF